MMSSDVDTLQLLVDNATQWRTLALTVNVELNIITTQINNQDVILAWDETAGMWNIRTQ